MEVTVDVDCDAADSPREVGGVVVGVLLLCLNEDREGGSICGTGGLA